MSFEEKNANIYILLNIILLQTFIARSMMSEKYSKTKPNPAIFIAVENFNL